MPTHWLREFKTKVGTAHPTRPRDLRQIDDCKHGSVPPNKTRPAVSTQGAECSLLSGGNRVRHTLSGDIRFRSFLPRK